MLWGVLALARWHGPYYSRGCNGIWAGEKGRGGGYGRTALAAPPWPHRLGHFLLTQRDADSFHRLAH